MIHDEDLALRAAAGDRGAFEVLVGRHARALNGFCRRVLGDESEAEDRVQEAFLRAYERLDRFDPRFRFSSWLYKIAQNLCIDALRGRRAWASLPEEEPEGAALPPLRLASDRDDRAALLVAIDELPPKLRAVLHRKYALDESAAEIGRALDMTPGNVRVCLHRAIRLLRSRLEPQ